MVCMCVFYIVKYVILNLKCTEMLLAAGFRRDPLGQVTALPRPHNQITRP